MRDYANRTGIISLHLICSESLTYLIIPKHIKGPSTRRRLDARHVGIDARPRLTLKGLLYTVLVTEPGPAGTGL